MTRNFQRFALRFVPVSVLLSILAYTLISPAPALAQGSAVVAVTSPAQGSTVVGTVMVRASVSPAGAVVTGVRFQVDWVDLGAEDTEAPYEIPWDTTTSSNGVHTLLAVARDALGTRYVSDPVRVTVANGPLTETRFEETDVSTEVVPQGTSYTVGWIHRVAGRPFSGGTAAYSPKTDGRATFTFTGTSVRWIGFRGPQTGIALVFLDGELAAQVDTYSPTEEVKAVLYSIAGIGGGLHTLWIEVTGLKNPASSDSLIVVDAFDVGPPSPPPAFPWGNSLEETDPSASYTPGWNQGDTTAAWSKGTAATSVTPGARADFAFSGTSVNWIGYRGPDAGIARVFVDGIFQEDVDLYEPFRLQAVTFNISGLEDTTHTLTIEVTGQKNPASTDILTVVDALNTRSRYEEAHPSIAYTGTWELTNSRAWSDRNAVFTWEAGASATFTFTGRYVRWIGYRGPIGGIARVFLDGNLVAEIDTFRLNEEVQAVIYEAWLLVPGAHTLRIEATGEMNKLSQKPFIAIDAFDINF